MGLLQKACETYDLHASLAGVYREGHEPLLPIGHNLSSAKIEITLNEKGAFVTARSVAKDEPKVIFPVTQESGGRTSSPCAHPLCDTIEYISPDNEQKHQLYLSELSAWEGSSYTHPMLTAILTYARSGTIRYDLDRSGISFEDKDLVCWRVLGILNEEEACWKNQALFEKYRRYYFDKLAGTQTDFCMITGRNDISAKQHSKGVFSFAGNAKLISANDNSGYTYRGRFTAPEQAATISYEASQKAHNALRWIISEQKAYYGGKAFICWNPSGLVLPALTDPFGFTAEEGPKEPSAYKKQLRDSLNGYRTGLPDEAGVEIASFEAATPGRLSIAFYSELTASDFLQRLYEWDEHCCWYGTHGEIRSPSLRQIVNCAFGHEQEGKGFVTDDELMAREMQRLVACRVEKMPIPMDIRNVLVQRASSPQAFSSGYRAQILSTACAVLRKHYFDRKGEDFEMALEPNKPDLSYQYGRLLAVLEKIETDTYGTGDDSREPNAIRMQAVFCQKPQYASSRILEQLKRAYLPRLKPGTRAFYEKLMGEIYEQISAFSDNELNRPLKDLYLIGYYLQKNELYKSHSDKKMEEEENGSEE